jgi:hypothetical protein
MTNIALMYCVKVKCFFIVFYSSSAQLSCAFLQVPAVFGHSLKSLVLTINLIYVVSYKILVFTGYIVNSNGGCDIID